MSNTSPMAAKRDVLVVANLGLGEKFLDHGVLYQHGLSETFADVALVSSEELMSRVDRVDRSRQLILFLDKDVALAELLELQGAVVVNSSRAIEICDDKRRTYAHLAAAGLRIPKTMMLPPVYPKQQIAFGLVMSMIDEIGLPMVIKEAKGSFGAQVYLANTAEDVFALVDALADRHLLAQEFVASSRGRDLRLQVVDGVCIAAIARQHPDDFRANLSAGGVGYPYQPSETERRLAEASANAVGGFNVGVDLLFDEENEGSIVCEVNSNAHIWRLSAISGIDVTRYVGQALGRWLQQ
ncbi:ATP-grasp domain-containing protein [Ferrimicrobium acidiphilum]|uniref:ATP-grasp domain-containing protein n=2 Tax=Ferrimicrobium acidiphilum TaxID=121039 RepID=UPI0023F02EED|nr:RimK family alpha-L-glutamate ligase [Ferrimicrobium acidiphilum]